MKSAALLDHSDLGLPLRLPGRVRLNSARVVAEGTVRPETAAKHPEEDFTEKFGVAANSYSLTMRVFEFDLKCDDEVVLKDADSGLPLVIRRADGGPIVNLDTRATQVFQFCDSKRPIYTYIPGFQAHMILAAIRRPLSNPVQSLCTSGTPDAVQRFRALPLTSFEYVLLLLNTILAVGRAECFRPFHWPSGKRAVLISLHDVDTKAFLQCRKCDRLFRIEEKHQIRSTWFIPTTVLNEDVRRTDSLLSSNHNIGWHGHKHDHRENVKPHADQPLRALANSHLRDPTNFPLGTRLPTLLKSTYLFELLKRSCPTLCYDTSFPHGIAPCFLWLNGRQSRILEIPTTVPTDVLAMHSLSRA